MTDQDKNRLRDAAEDLGAITLDADKHMARVAVVIAQNLIASLDTTLEVMPPPGVTPVMMDAVKQSAIEAASAMLIARCAATMEQAQALLPLSQANVQAFLEGYAWRMVQKVRAEMDRDAP